MANGGTGATTALAALKNLGIEFRISSTPVHVGSGGASVTFDEPFIDTIPNWQQGYIDKTTGLRVTNADYLNIRICSGPIKVKAGAKISCASGYYFRSHMYSTESEDSYIGMIADYGTVEQTVDRDCYVRASLRKSDASATIATSAGVNLFVDTANPPFIFGNSVSTSASPQKGALSFYSVTSTGFSLASSVNQNDVRWIAIRFPL